MVPKTIEVTNRLSGFFPLKNRKRVIFYQLCIEFIQILKCYLKAPVKFVKMRGTM